MEQVNISDIRGEIRTLVASEEVNFAQIARETGLSSGTISGWMNEKYNGNNDRVEAEIRGWLDNFRQTTEMPETPGFIETPTSKQIWTTFRYARSVECIGIVCGNPGVGKTEAARAFCRENNNVWLVTISPSCASVRECLAGLAEELGIDPAPSLKGPLSRAVRRRLTGTKGLIIIDEADHLEREALEELRLLQEATRVGMVLMGNHRVYTNMTGSGKTVEFARLFSRIARRVAIDRIKKTDVEAIADAWGITGKQERTLLQQVAQKPGALRILNHSLQQAALEAHGAGVAINEKHIREVFKDLNLDVDISKVFKGE